MVRLLLRMSLCASLCALTLATGVAGARALTARVERVITPVATLHAVQVRLDWPTHAPQGQLHLRAQRLEAPEMGYRFDALDWRCPLQRDGQGGWRCDGVLRSAGAAPSRLSLVLGVASTDALLTHDDSRLSLHRNAATPHTSRIDLARVPLAWTQALLARAWPQARITGGRLDGELTVLAATGQPLRIAGPLQLSAAALDTPDGSIAAEGVGARIALDARFGDTDRIILDGALLGGELLFGTTYVALQQRTVGLQIEATRQGEQGWQLPRVQWQDGNVLSVDGSAALAADASVREVDLRLRSGDLSPLGEAYLSGWLGRIGLSGLQFDGTAESRLRISEGRLREAAIELTDASIDDPDGRFSFAGLHGEIRYSSTDPVASELRWQGGELYGLAFGTGRLPFESGDGELRLQQAVTVPMLGGSARFEQLRIRPPAQGSALELRFGLALDRLDVGQLAQALGWPAFTGTLSGQIPQADYVDDRLVFDGGLSMQVFGGDVEVSALAMERPFGVAPTLSADIALDDLDLQALTGVLGFGSITGKLDGRIDGLRLVDWQPTAFDAELRTDRSAARRSGVGQRISQRAVQDLSSVGDASFGGSLQAQLIGLFDDFGYARIGIACRLANEVCRMDGLGPAGASGLSGHSGSGAPGFTIVQGSGLPRLTVVGYNRQVDWPTLVERLTAVGTGEVKPVIE